MYQKDLRFLKLGGRLVFSIENYIAMFVIIVEFYIILISLIINVNY